MNKLLFLLASIRNNVYSVMFTAVINVGQPTNSYQKYSCSLCVVFCVHNLLKKLACFENVVV